jgi:hypothetical protein
MPKSKSPPKSKKGKQPEPVPELKPDSEPEPIDESITFMTNEVNRIRVKVEFELDEEDPSVISLKVFP